MPGTAVAGDRFDRVASRRRGTRRGARRPGPFAAATCRTVPGTGRPSSGRSGVRSVPERGPRYPRWGCSVCPPTSTPRSWATAWADFPTRRAACSVAIVATGDVAAATRPATSPPRPSSTPSTPREHLRADRDAEARGIEIIGVFHSHTHTDAYPSPTDVAQAPDPGWHYVLVSLRDTHPTLRSYRIHRRGGRRGAGRGRAPVTRRTTVEC